MKTMTLTLDENLHLRMKLAAVRSGGSMLGLIRRAIETEVCHAEERFSAGETYPEGLDVEEETPSR